MKQISFALLLIIAFLSSLAQSQDYYVIQAAKINPSQLSGRFIYTQNQAISYINQNFKGFL